MTRKYLPDDVVIINHDGYNNFPKGTMGIIKLLGMKRKGVYTYHVNFITETSEEPLVVRESEIDLIGDDDTRYPYTYACDYIRQVVGMNSVTGDTKLSRADASLLRQEMAKVARIDPVKFAHQLANKYLEKQAKAVIKLETSTLWDSNY